MKPKGTPYDLLHTFAGRWNTEGRIPPTAGTPEILVRGTDTYHWLPGGFFMMHIVDVMVGDERHQTTEIIGYDPLARHYTLQYYDNKGNTGVMTATVMDEVWTFSGYTLRFTGGFVEEDRVFIGVWSRSEDGEHWQHYMDIKLTRVD